MAKYTGTNGADTYTGTADADQITGGSGNDVLGGAGGDDTIDGGADHDTLSGGLGNDTLLGNTGNDTLGGDEGDDTLDGGAGSNVLRGGLGNDILRVLAGFSDVNDVDGGDGDDIVSVSGGTLSRLIGGAGTDRLAIQGPITVDRFAAQNGFERLDKGGTVQGNAGANTLDFSGLVATAAGGGLDLKGLAGDDVLTGTNVRDRIYGGTQNDAIHGGNGNDDLFGEDGDDRIWGDAGKDAITGSYGNDTLYGGADDDTLDGGAGNDTIDGGDGNDVLKDTAGSNALSGGAGNDEITVSMAAADVVTVDGGDGDDRVAITYGRVSDVRGGAGTDTLWISGTVMSRFGAENGFEKLDGNFAITGTDGDDRLDFSGLAFATPRANDNGISVGGGGGADTITGTIGRDTITGGDGNDELSGYEGDDTLNGYAGDDTLFGGNGNDLITDTAGHGTIFGDAGDDTIETSSGDDFINAGDGNDSVKAAGGRNTVYGMAGDDTISSSGSGETLDGGEGNDTITASGGLKNLLTGGAGYDTLNVGGYLTVGHFSVASSGFERIKLGSGLVGTDADDAIDLSGFEILPGSLQAAVNAGAGNDLIRGTALADNLKGEAGDDVIEGGDGNDVLHGGFSVVDGKVYAGVDIASYEHAASAVSVDLARTSAQDTIGAGKDTLAGFEGLRGSAFGDLLSGDKGDNSLHGRAGDDTLRGLAGNDLIDGGEGQDTAEGGDGIDIIFGRDGADTLNGGSGADTIEGNDGDDVLQAGGALFQAPGKDAVGAPGDKDVLIGGAGADRYLFATREDASIYQTFDRYGKPAGETENGGVRTLVEFRAEEGDTLDFRKLGLAFNGERSGSSARTGITYERTAEGTIVHIDSDGDGKVNASIQLDRSVELFEVEPGLLKGRAVLVGTEGADTLVGSAQDETIRALGGNDSLEGGLGNDRLIGGAGADDMASYAGAGVGVTVTLMKRNTGQDTIGAGTDTLTEIEGLRGSAHGDTLTGDDARNTILGGAGDDVIRGGRGADLLDGEAGADTYIVDRYDLVGAAKTVALDMADQIKLTGFGTLTWTDRGFTGVAGQVRSIAREDGQTLVQIDTNGDRKADAQFFVSTMTKLTFADNTIRKSDDFVSVEKLGPGDDSWTAQNGNDKVYGLDGNDTINGLAGKDLLYGDNGNDTLNGGADADTLMGGNGNDRLDGGSGADQMHGGAGADIYIVDDGGDTVNESRGADLPADQQFDTVLSSVTYQLGDWVENLTLTADGISGVGNRLDNVMRGGAGSNALYGMDGNDWLDGGAGNDLMVGGRGSDTYVVDDAYDAIQELAGEGNDLVLASISYTLGENVELLELTGVEAINGTGNAGENRLQGNAAGNILHGGDGDDYLAGQDGGDALFGDAGRDTLVGGGGIDTMWGGDGDDTIYFALIGDAQNDLVVGVVHGDRLDLSAIDANAGTAYNDAFTFVGTAAFSGTAGELRIAAKPNETGAFTVSADTDGDGTADLTIHLQNTVLDLGSAEFVL